MPFSALVSAGELTGQLPSESPAPDYAGSRPGLVKGRLKQHGTGHSRDHFQQFSSSHQVCKNGFLRNGKHDEIDLPSDSELPIPEGVGIWLHWSRASERALIEATLLNNDPLNCQIIFEVEMPLSARSRTDRFRILPRVDELLKAVKGKLTTLGVKPNALSWRLLSGNLHPTSIPWGEPIDSSDLDGPQLDVVQRCLRRDISFVWGPPGTGKTYTLGKLIATAAADRLSPAAVALDQ